MDIPEIQKTKDYSIFKFVNFNRQKSKSHTEQIKKMILNENLLHLHPILVNQNMELIDGQHRLEAAEALGLEIYYIKADLSYEHILNSNLLQKKLTLGDAIKFYAIKDAIPDYIQFGKMSETLKMNPKALIGLLFGGMSRSLVEFIKSGKFKMPKEEQLVKNMIENFSKFLFFVKEKKVTPFSMFTSTHFTIAFRYVSSLPNFNMDIFISKLNLKWFELKPLANTQEWIKSLITIYNFKNQNPINVPNA